MTGYFFYYKIAGEHWYKYQATFCIYETFYVGPSHSKMRLNDWYITPICSFFYLTSAARRFTLRCLLCVGAATVCAAPGSVHQGRALCLRCGQWSFRYSALLKGKRQICSIFDLCTIRICTFVISSAADPIQMFLGLPDPHQDPLVTGTDPDPFIIKQN